MPKKQVIWNNKFNTKYQYKKHFTTQILTEHMQLIL